MYNSAAKQLKVIKTSVVCRLRLTAIDGDHQCCDSSYTLICIDFPCAQTCYGDRDKTDAELLVAL